jgi:hypothetical protein
MKIDDPDTREKLQRLASIEARLAHHEGMAQLILPLVAVLGALVLGVLAYHLWGHA